MPFPLDPAFIARTQERLGRSLPLGYIASILKENGGVATVGGESWFLFPIFDDSDRRRLKRTCNDVLRETAVAQRRPDFPNDGIAIAENGAGDILLFLPSPHDPSRYGGTVFLWRHDGEVHPVVDDFLELRRPG